MICPKCGENQAHRSHRAGWKDRLYRIFQMIPYRCHRCSTRFYAYRAGKTSSKLRTPEELKIVALRRKMRWKRAKLQLLIFGAAAILLLALLYQLMQQS